jgi:hypothetical protein
MTGVETPAASDHLVCMDRAECRRILGPVLFSSRRSARHGSPTVIPSGSVSPRGDSADLDRLLADAGDDNRNAGIVCV